MTEMIPPPNVSTKRVNMRLLSSYYTFYNIHLDEMKVRKDLDHKYVLVRLNRS